MKIEIPEKIKVVITIVDRIGVPTVLCLIFAYIYFVKLDKLITIVSDFVKVTELRYETMKNDHEEIKREIRRIGYRRGQ